MIVITSNIFSFVYFYSSLQVLSMGANKIREVPDTIGNLAQLQGLNLCDNLVDKIPSSIARLHNLKTLSLHKNAIRTLPPELISLRNLTELSLRDNPLVERFVQRTYLPSSFILPPSNLALNIFYIHRSLNDTNNIKGKCSTSCKNIQPTL
jgi:Leucine-rich repeat (LRR) protein